VPSSQGTPERLEQPPPHFGLNFTRQAVPLRPEPKTDSRPVKNVLLANLVGFGRMRWCQPNYHLSLSERTKWILPPGVMHGLA